jgi:hypothetical protein
LDVTKLDDLADAITILTGDAQATIVMDSEGNMLN